MHNSDLIPPHHLACKAVMDLRPSTPHQVVSLKQACACSTPWARGPTNSVGPTRPADIMDDDLASRGYGPPAPR